MSEDFDFTGAYGSEVAQQAGGKGGSFAREVEYMSLKASEADQVQGKDRMLVRFLTDATLPPGTDPLEGPRDHYELPWITVAQHYAPTKSRPAYVREGRMWFDKWNAVCRQDKVFAKSYPDCYLCKQNSKASNRIWALGVEREQVKDETGRILGIRDKTRDLPIFGPDNKPVEGQVRQVPAFMLMNYGWKNFFSNIDGQARYFNTVLDTDYLVVRTGTDNNNTNYSFVRLDPITLGENNPWGVPAGTKYDLSDRDLMRKVYPELPDLRKIVGEKTSDDYYGYWFVPGWQPKESGQPSTGQGQGPAVPSTQVSQEVPTDALATLRSRVTGKPQAQPVAFSSGGMQAL